MSYITFKLVSVLTLFTLLVLPPGSQGRQKCGILTQRAARIIGGNNANQPYPWFMAFVQIPINILQPTITRVTCGGSLITQRDVLTAAHCFNKILSPKDSFVVFSGLQNICTLNDNVVQHRIQKTLSHIKYQPKSAWYDIAIVTLKTKVDGIPICLPSPKDTISRRGEAVGFGFINNNQELPCRLQVVEINSYNQSICNKMLQENGLPKVLNAFCAGDLNGGQDSCQGDSGGPFQILSENGTYTLYGIVSFGFRCALPNKLGVYTSVKNYINWIRKYALLML